MFQSFDAIRDLIWLKQVPLKVSISAWRVLRNKLLMKVNLVAHDIITQDAQLCVTGCGGMHRDNSTFVPILSKSRIHLGSSLLVDWCLFYLSVLFTGSGCSVYLFLRWFVSLTFFYATYLTLLRLGIVE